MQPRHKTAQVLILTLILISGCKGQTIGLPEILQPGTPVPTATPTLISSPTPIPTPTPMPVQVIGEGERDLRNGNWDAAMLAFQQVITDPGATPPEQASAHLGLAHASLERGDFG